MNNEDKNMTLTHEYNEYAAGFIVTDEETGRSVNFQLQEYASNHPLPDYYFTHSCGADETNESFTEDELRKCQEYLDSQKEVSDLLETINEKKDELGSFEFCRALAEKGIAGNGVYKCDFSELKSSALDEE